MRPGLPYGTEANIAKLIGSQAASHAIERSMQTMGGMGYAREFTSNACGSTRACSSSRRCRGDDPELHRHTILACPSHTEHPEARRGTGPGRHPRKRSRTSHGRPPIMFNLSASIAFHARRTPDKAAIVYRDQEIGYASSTSAFSGGSHAARARHRPERRGGAVHERTARLSWSWPSPPATWGRCSAGQLPAGRARGCLYPGRRRRRAAAGGRGVRRHRRWRRPRSSSTRTPRPIRAGWVSPAWRSRRRSPWRKPTWCA